MISGSLLYDPAPTGKIDNLDSYLFTILGSIGVVTSLLLFSTHLFNSKLRKSPGDLIVMVAFAELLLTIHWVLTGLFSPFILSKDYAKENSTFCKVNGVIAVVGANLEIAYNFSFIMYIYLKVRYMNSKMITTLWFHIGSISVTVCVLLYNYFRGHIGMNAYGTCSIRKVSILSIVLGGLSLVALSFFSVYVLVYTNRVLP